LKKFVKRYLQLEKIQFNNERYFAAQNLTYDLIGHLGKEN